MTEPHIHVGLTRRIRLHDGTTADLTINVSGIPSTAGPGLIDAMVHQVASTAIDQILAETERRAKDLALVRNPPAALVNLDALAGHDGGEEGVGGAIPDDVAIDVLVVGVMIRIREYDHRDLSEGQLVAVNAGLTSHGFKGHVRHDACEVILNSYEQAVHGALPSVEPRTVRVFSTRDLRWSDAGIMLDWLANADEKAVAELANEVAQMQCQPQLPTQRAQSLPPAAPDAVSEPSLAIIDAINAPLPDDLRDQALAEGDIDDPEGESLREPEIILSPGQQAALDGIMAAVRSGDNSGQFIFVTGKAGTGKSTVLRQLRSRVRAIVCAPTGLAAVNVGGTTIHSAFRLTIGPKTKSSVDALSGDRAEVIRRAQVIVIDEVSMVRADLLDGIDICLRKTLRNDLPFGGKLVVAFGDLWQLEPVVDSGERAWMDKMYASPFFFDAAVFRGHRGQGELIASAGCEIERYDLADVFRQKDEAFVAALNSIRIGDPSGLSVINSRAGTQPSPDLTPVILTMTNDKARGINDTHLAQLSGESRVYNAKVTGDMRESEHPVPAQIELRIGARVMVARNTISEDAGYVSNGAIGTVTALFESGPRVELDDGRDLVVTAAEWSKSDYAPHPEKDDEIVQTVRASFSQIPVKLAWAITIHKSQGQTLEAAVVELERQARTHGIVYVALSRVKSLDGLYLRRVITPREIVTNARIREWCGVTPAATLDADALAS